MNWTTTPPTAPGRYWWRRTWQWEPVARVTGHIAGLKHCV